MTDADPAALARTWLLSSQTATLCTLSTAEGLEGFPFGSIVPFALDERGRPLVLLAEIAEHTKNAGADARVSLFVAEPAGAGDPQAGWRMNLAGCLTRLRTTRQKPGRAAAREDVVDDDSHAALLARYLERVPAAVDYVATHDFYLWRLDVQRARNIVGFGSMGWIDGKALERDPDGGGLGGARAGAIEHMNTDHKESLIEMARGLAGVTPKSATLIDVDRTGMLVKTREPDRLLHFSFGKEVDAQGIRGAVVDVLRRARAAGA